MTSPFLNSATTSVGRQYPRFIVSGLCGGSGKTLLALGLARALSVQGLKVKPYKKGPDYIDAAWLSLASGMTATNLDLFFLPAERTRDLFIHAFSEAVAGDACGQPHAASADLAIIEGNRGLFDGRDLAGSCSTAALAEVLDAPVIVAMNCTKMTRTAAAIVLGLLQFTPRVNLAGVVLNNIGTTRHAAIVRRSIEEYTPVPVLGALPRLAVNPIPERHMGLTTMPLFEGRAKKEARDANSCSGNARDTEWSHVDSRHSRNTHGSDHRPERAVAALEMLAAFVKENVDVDKVVAAAQSAGPLVSSGVPFWPEPRKNVARRPRIAYVRDASLWFYYSENLEALSRAGADLCEVSLLAPPPWPEIDGLYLGGGFPEDTAEELSASPHLKAIREFSLSGMPIYAECGGFMLLCHELECGAKNHLMAGIFPGRAVFRNKPQGLGYVEAEVTGQNPFYPVGSILRGHEFHFSAHEPEANVEPVLRLKQGTGMGHGRDGLTMRNTYAGYTHIFAPNTPCWADNFVDLALVYCQQKIKRL